MIINKKQNMYDLIEETINNSDELLEVFNYIKDHDESLFISKIIYDLDDLLALYRIDSKAPILHALDILERDYEEDIENNIQNMETVRYWLSVVYLAGLLTRSI